MSDKITLPHPRELYAIADKADRLGLRLRWCSTTASLEKYGTVFRLAVPDTTRIVYACDTLADVCDYLDRFERAA